MYKDTNPATWPKALKKELKQPWNQAKNPMDITKEAESKKLHHLTSGMLILRKIYVETWDHA